jgi:endoglucanase
MLRAVTARRISVILLAFMALTIGSTGLALAQSAPWYAGVNMAGAEFKPKRLPGRVFKDYTFPAEKELAYFAGHGMNVIRLPFLWERLQPELMAPLDQTQLDYIKSTVAMAKKHNLSVVLDLHNFGRYRGKEVGTPETPDAAFADVWTRLADAFANDPAVIFGLMNEPARIPADRWAKSAAVGMAAIRKTGAKNLVLVPGTFYSGAHSWGLRRGGASNADALSGFTDPANNFAFEAHQYFDRDHSGTSPTCRSEQVGVNALKNMTDWLRKEGRKGFLGEFGVGRNPTCLGALRGTLAFMQDNADVWIGWTYWAAGGWWGNYAFSVEPARGGIDRPQMSILKEFAQRAKGRP